MRHLHQKDESPLAAARRRLAPPLLWLAAGACELPLLSAFLAGGARVDFSAALLLHAAACVFMFFAAYPRPSGRGASGASAWLRRPWWEPMTALTFALPGIGWIIAAVLWLETLPRQHDHKAVAAPASGRREFVFDDPADEDEEQEPDDARFSGPAMPELERLYQESDALPAADALAAGDPSMQRGAVEALARIGSSEAISKLMHARRHPNADVRFYATSALTNLKRDHERRLKAAEREAFERPTETGPLVRLCQAHYEYAVSGLADEGGRQEMLAKCRKWLSDAARADDAGLRLLFKVERELMPETALALLGELSQRVPAEREAWLKERAAILFRLGRYGEARATVKEVVVAMAGRFSTVAPETAAAALDDREWRGAALWWSGA